jgi:glycosyltransferase involved in cell wall biosynthesis
VNGPLVSVIVPVYNGARYLAEALDSVVEQRGCRLDVIVVDDGSLDESGTIARAFSGVRYYRQSNAGVAAARNAGLRRARGSFIAFLDQDDWWPRDKLATQLAHLDTHPDCGLVVGRVRVQLDDGQPFPAWLPRDALGKDRIAYPPGTWLVRAPLFHALGPFDERLVNGSDFDWLVRAIDSGARIEAVDRGVLVRRVHGTNASHRTDLRRPEHLRILADSLRRRRAAGGGDRES